MASYNDTDPTDDYIDIEEMKRELVRMAVREREAVDALEASNVANGAHRILATAIVVFRASFDATCAWVKAEEGEEQREQARRMVALFNLAQSITEGRGVMDVPADELAGARKALAKLSVREIEVHIDAQDSRNREAVDAKDDSVTAFEFGSVAEEIAAEKEE